MEIDTLVVMLYQNPDYKPGKKKKHSIRLPDLSLAMQELVEELALRDERLLEHPAKEDASSSHVQIARDILYVPSRRRLDL